MAVNLKPEDLPKGYKIKARSRADGGLIFDLFAPAGNYVSFAVVEPANVENEVMLEAEVAEMVRLAKEHTGQPARDRDWDRERARVAKEAREVADKLNKG